MPWEVPTGISNVPFRDRHGVAFIGNFNHMPNVDAAYWLADTVMPLVWQTDPSIECLLVGSQMPDPMRQLARPGLVPLGQVEDRATVFDRVRLTVAALRYGAGVKGKVLTSFGAGVPCIMTPIAAEGLAWPTTLSELVGRDATELADLIHRLHHDAAANLKASEAGQRLIAGGYNQASVVTALQQAIDLHPDRSETGTALLTRRA